MALSAEREARVWDRIFTLEDAISWDLDQCLTVLFNNWEEAWPTFNEGQNTIYYNYIYDTLMWWADEAMVNWPWVYADDYMYMVYESYDPFVMDQAFSFTIEGPVDRMQSIIEGAQRKAMVIEALSWLF